MLRMETLKSIYNIFNSYCKRVSKRRRWYQQLTDPANTSIHLGIVIDENSMYGTYYWHMIDEELRKTIMEHANDLIEETVDRIDSECNEEQKEEHI